MVKSKVTLLVKDIVAPSWIISVAWMPESMSKQFVGIEGRHPVKMRRTLFKIMSKK